MADDGIDELLLGVWRKNRPVALERARLLAALAAADEELRATAHKLAGSLGMYGLARASDLARQVDDLVVDGALADGRRPDVAAAAAELVAALEASPS